MINYESIWRQVECLPWCALVASGRTGSDAFQSILDSHPEIFVINGQLEFYQFWNSATTVEHAGHLCVEDIADEFIGRHIKMLKSRYDLHENKHRLGETMDQSIDVDIPTFRGHLIGLLKPQPVNARNFLTGVYVAYAICLGQAIEKKKMFFHHIHRVRRFDTFLIDFPESRIIGMTRDPRAAYVSGIEHWRRLVPEAHHPSFPQQILERIVDELEPLLRHGDRFRVLRLEDLADEEVLTRVCDWLGVSFHPCMWKSTWAGLRWWGDRLSAVTAVKGMSEQDFTVSIRRSNWKERLSALDKFVLNYLLSRRLAACSFEHSRAPAMICGPLVFLAILLPTRYEMEWLTPSRLVSLLIKRQFRLFLGVFYHYARRVAYFYRLFFRRLFGQWVELPLFGARQGPRSPVVAE